ncbi:hypothetical protein ACVWYG_000898 [Pedobacter sp. UYEF25]
MKKIAIVIAFLFTTQINTGSTQTKEHSTKKVLDIYYQLKNALAADDDALAAKTATLLAVDLSQAKPAAFATGSQGIWIKQSAEAKSAALSIAASAEIVQQRKLFGKLSNAMIKIFKNLKLGKDAVFVQYCPMAKESWLNETKKIENPYYGKSMLTCGTVKEAINEQ